MNQFEYKKRYDPESGMYVKKHVHSGEIYGGALTDILKSQVKVDPRSYERNYMQLREEA